MRGLYISLQAMNIGNYILPSFKQNIIGNSQNENILLDLLHFDEYKSISLYDLNTIFDSPVLTSALANFIKKAKAGGVIEVNAAVAAIKQIDAVMKFNSTYPGSAFTGFVSEFEYWTPGGGTFVEFLTLLKYMDGKGLKRSCYLGWLKVSGLPTLGVAKKIANLVDRIYLHAYVLSPASALPYIQARMNDFISTTKPLELMPIFSTEGPGKSAGGEIYMGAWLADNSMPQAETIFLNDYNNSYHTPTNVTLVGFQYFEYGFLS